MVHRGVRGGDVEDRAAGTSRRSIRHRVRPTPRFRRLTPGHGHSARVEYGFRRPEQGRRRRGQGPSGRSRFTRSSFCSNGRKSMKSETISWPVASLLAVAGMLVVTGCETQKLGGEAAVKTRSATVAPAAILTTDCGCEADDQWTLAHLLLSPEVDLRAVITTHASSIRFSSATGREKAAEVVQKIHRRGPRPSPLLPDLRSRCGMRRPPGRTPVWTCCFVFLETFPNRAASPSSSLAPVPTSHPRFSRTRRSRIALPWLPWASLIGRMAATLQREERSVRMASHPQLRRSAGDRERRRRETRPEADESRSGRLMRSHGPTGESVLAIRRLAHS